jgi:cysteine synthase A
MTGKTIDAFVCGVGTGGTITGVGEVLKSKHPDTEIVAVEPRESAVLSGGKPGPHDIPGLGAGFIPKILNMSILDTIIPVSSEDACHTARLLAEKEGLFVGLSSGAACFAGLEVAERLGRDKNVVVLFPDPGNRYVLRENLVAHP